MFDILEKVINSDTHLVIIFTILNMIYLVLVIHEDKIRISNKIYQWQTSMNNDCPSRLHRTKTNQRLIRELTAVLFNYKRKVF